MNCKLTIVLEGREGVVRNESFSGKSEQDLSMLGAAKGWLEGLYNEAEPIVMAAGMAGPMKELYAEMNKPRPLPMPPVSAERFEKPLAASEAVPS